MRQLTVADGRAVLVDDDDYVNLSVHHWSIGSHGYTQRWCPVGRTTILLHRELLGLRPGDGLIGDHVNRNPLDCRRTNLRVVTPSGSSQNVTGRGASRFRNVYRMRDRWQAKIKFQGTVHHLGTYDTEEEAADVATNYRLRLMPMATD